MDNLYKIFLDDFYNKPELMVYMFESKFRYSLCEHFRDNLSFKNKWLEHMENIYNKRNDYSFLNKICNSQKRILQFFFLKYKLNEFNKNEIIKEWESINLNISIKEIIIIHFLLRDEFYIENSKLLQRPITKKKVLKSLQYLKSYSNEEIKETILSLTKNCFSNDQKHIKSLKFIITLIE